MSRDHENLNENDEKSLEVGAGMDEYVLDCRKCPINLPHLVAGERIYRVNALSHLGKIEIASKHLEDVVNKLVEQLQTTDFDMDRFINIAPSLGFTGGDDGFDIHLTEEQTAMLREYSIDHEAFLISVNDQYKAELVELGMEVREHTFDSHPGRVVCGGSIEVAGRTLCGAIIDKVPCSDSSEIGSEVVMLSVRRGVERER